MIQNAIDNFSLMTLLPNYETITLCAVCGNDRLSRNVSNYQCTLRNISEEQR